MMNKESFYVKNGSHSPFRFRNWQAYNKRGLIMIKTLFICILVLFFITPNLTVSQVKRMSPHLKRERLQISPHKFLLPRFAPIRFKAFELSDFKIRSGHEMVRLKSGKVIRADQFLREVNEIEKRLNEWGYTLRDNRPVRIQFNYPKNQLRLQKEIFLKRIKGLGVPSQIFCEETLTGEGEKLSETDRPKDFVPLVWEKNWDASFGNEDIGVKLSSNMKIEGKENSLNIQPFFLTDAFLLGSHINLLWVGKKENLLVIKLLGGKEIKYSLSHQWIDRELLNEPFDWSEEIGFSMGAIELAGKIELTGRIKMTVNQKEEPSSLKAEGSFSPHLWAKVFGKLECDFEIVEARMSGEILMIENGSLLAGRVELVRSSNRYFKLSASGRTKATLLRGRLMAYAEIDYLIGSKRFEVEFFDFEGIELDQPLFSVNTSIPAEKDHHLWLKINHIGGITPYTARNERLEIDPKGFELIVEIGGRRYVKELKDFNGDGHYGNVLGEYEAVKYEVPLLSFKKVPISIEVIQKYRIGTFEFNDSLDFVQGGGKRVEICYDPRTRTFAGTLSGKEDEEKRSIGDSTYWGERYHLIIFELSTEGFRSAPAKAK